MLTLLFHALKHGSADYSPWAKPSPLSVFVNKLFMGTQPGSSFSTVSMAAFEPHSRVEEVKQIPVVHGAKMISSLAPYRVSSPIPTLNSCSSSLKLISVALYVL